MNEESSKAMDRLLAKLETADPTEELSLKNLRKGSFLKIEDNYYEILSFSKYIEDEEWEWVEMTVFSVNDGKNLFLEMEEDDEVEFCLTTEVKVPVNEVFKSFDDMVARTKTRDKIVFRGKCYRFDEKCTAMFYKDGSNRPQKVKMFDFTQDEYGLTIEKWGKGEDDYEISLCQYFDEDEVEVAAL